MWGKVGIFLLMPFFIRQKALGLDYKLNCPKKWETVDNQNVTFRLGGIKFIDTEAIGVKGLLKKCVAVNGSRDLDYVTLHNELIQTNR